MNNQEDTQALHDALEALQLPLGRILLERGADFRALPGNADRVWLVDADGEPVKASTGSRAKTKACQNLFEALKPFLEDFVVLEDFGSSLAEIEYRVSARLLAEHEQQQMDRRLPRAADPGLKPTPSLPRKARF